MKYGKHPTTGETIIVVEAETVIRGMVESAGMLVGMTGDRSLLTCLAAFWEVWVDNKPEALKEFVEGCVKGCEKYAERLSEDPKFDLAGIRIKG